MSFPQTTDISLAPKSGQPLTPSMKFAWGADSAHVTLDLLTREVAARWNSPPHWKAQSLNLSSVLFEEPLRPMALSQRGLHVVVNTRISSENYSIVAQSRTELIFPDNSPSLSIWPYLVGSSQTRLLNEISIYSALGTSIEQSRLLYMNAGALRLWREMGMPTTVIGESHRPPRTATLCFGMPFSE